ncbi:hypothetical protein ABTE96_20580, partial [Acinetobacter baumannii]
KTEAEATNEKEPNESPTSAVTDWTATPEQQKKPDAQAEVEARRGSHTYSSIDPDRPGLLSMAAESMKHLEKAEKDRKIVFRHSDKTSI